MLNVGNRRRNLNGNESNFNKISSVCMYNEPPVDDVSFDDFEESAIDRLHVLKSIELNRSRGLSYKELENRIDRSINTYLPMRPVSMRGDAKKDNLSHFILRIAYCQNEDLRRWFLAQECFLFRYRLDKLSKEEKLHFMKQNRFEFEQVSEEDIQTRRNKLKDARDSNLIDITEKQKELGVYFRIPFTQALELIGQRQVYLEKGFAYVAIESVVSIIVAQFRSHLSHQLVVTYKNFSKTSIHEDERLVPILKNLSKQYLGPDYTTTSNTSNITAEQIDSLSKTHMPLCMTTLHNALKTHHHLRHGGRLQYGLFLKGIGLKLEQALIFWRKEFSKITDDEFSKKYAYNIRYNYGKEGKRTDYTPYNCARIINGDPAKSGDYHGCPFRQMEDMHLKSSLYGINEKSKEEILQLRRSKQYQLACRRYFEARYKDGNSDGVGNHPNAYFEAASEFYMNKNAPTGRSSITIKEETTTIKKEETPVKMESIRA